MCVDITNFMQLSHENLVNVDRLEREQGVVSVSHDFNCAVEMCRTGAFSAIKDAYNDSTASARRVNASEGTVDESADVREEIGNDVKVQPANSKELDGLNRNMASGPDLAPVAKEVKSCSVLTCLRFVFHQTLSSSSICFVPKVCGSVLSQPCTPLRCDADHLCPPEGTPPCQQGQKCVGALPLAKRADSDAAGVKDRLDKLTKKITDTAEKVAALT